ncbi:hypothetical protein [Stutzerimonas stutzeri]|nr:hypothetical protein [Stutzerimonas stutzeri]
MTLLSRWVNNSNISQGAANAVEGMLVLAISYDRNVQVVNWSDLGQVAATNVNIDISQC